jgi:hypothetical protein
MFTVPARVPIRSIAAVSQKVILFPESPALEMTLSKIDFIHHLVPSKCASMTITRALETLRNTLTTYIIYPYLLSA